MAVHATVRPLTLVASLLGALPVCGLWSDDVQRLHFRWLSWPTLFSLFITFSPTYIVTFHRPIWPVMSYYYAFRNTSVGFAVVLVAKRMPRLLRAFDVYDAVSQHRDRQSPLGVVWAAGTTTVAAGFFLAIAIAFKPWTPFKLLYLYAGCVPCVVRLLCSCCFLLTCATLERRFHAFPSHCHVDDAFALHRRLVHVTETFTDCFGTPLAVCVGTICSEILHDLYLSTNGYKPVGVTYFNVVNCATVVTLAVFGAHLSSAVSV